MDTNRINADLEGARRRALALLAQGGYTGHDAVVVQTLAAVDAIGRNGMSHVCP